MPVKGETTLPAEGRRRVVIEGVQPEVDAGRFPAKSSLGEPLVVEADVFADGHDLVAAALLVRRAGGRRWTELPMVSLGNDRWQGSFGPDEIGTFEYTVRGWIDRFRSWRRDLAKKVEAGQDVDVDIQAGAEIVAGAAERATGRDKTQLRQVEKRLRSGDDAVAAALDEDLHPLMARWQERRFPVTYDRTLEVWVERERARTSAWYEMFPRSAGSSGDHGTFADVEKRLPYVAEMGFDVLYLPPVHPIGRTHRKGRNNARVADRGDVGSPWAIGGEEGGHTAIHPDLGTMEDFEHLVERAADHGLEVALDVAFQCTPDHPWVRDHPGWFRHRADGTIQYAENPPKRYEDIYPLDFETEDWANLWQALLEVFEFWIGRGVQIFRVDNPHTKAFPFWEWCIGRIKAEHPDVILLAEAFTRPKVMHELAKLGFTQSYTYFTWRNTKWELEEYFGRDLPAVRDFFRPNLWPNTPDILTEYLQAGGRPAFLIRLFLAATLGASYGIYGPAFELMEDRPREPGSEEYLDSEKYEVRAWDVDRADSLREIVALVNRARSDNPALQSDRGLRFHSVDNDQLVAYSKSSPDGDNLVLVVVNLDPHHRHSGWVHLPLEDLGIDREHPYQLHDMVTGARYVWNGEAGYVELDPRVLPAHVFRVRRRLRTERDFDYFL